MTLGVERSPDRFGVRVQSPMLAQRGFAKLEKWRRPLPNERPSHGFPSWLLEVSVQRATEGGRGDIRELQTEVEEKQSNCVLC